MTWTLKPYDALSLHELYAVMALRQRVFVVEQNCPYLDADGNDVHALHLWHVGRDGAIEAYARLFGPGIRCDECSLGRVVSAPEVRRTGVGRALVAKALAALAAHYGAQPVRIHAQKYLERFYGSFGFAREGEDFDEDGIPHCMMVRPRG